MLRAYHSTDISFYAFVRFILTTLIRRTNQAF